MGAPRRTRFGPGVQLPPRAPIDERSLEDLARRIRRMRVPANQLPVGAVAQVSKTAAAEAAVSADDTSAHAITIESKLPPLQAGDILDVEAAGVVTTGTVPPSLTLSLKTGGVTLVASSGVLLTKSLTGQEWRGRATLQCNAIGASGQMDCRGVWFVPTLTDLLLKPLMGGGDGVVTVDTRSLALQWFATFSLAGSHSIRVRQFSVRRFSAP